MEHAMSHQTEMQIKMMAILKSMTPNQNSAFKSVKDKRRTAVNNSELESVDLSEIEESKINFEHNPDCPLAGLRKRATFARGKRTNTQCICPHLIAQRRESRERS